MRKILIIQKDATKAAMVSHQLGLSVEQTGTWRKVVIARNAKEASKLIGQKFDAVYVNDGDLLIEQQMKSLFGDIVRAYVLEEKYSLGEGWYGKLMYKVSKGLELLDTYWCCYNLKIFTHYPIHLLILFMLRVINIFKPIRIVEYISSRIGHQAYNTHIHSLKMLSEERHPAIIALTKEPANQALHEMQKRHWLFTLEKPWQVNLFMNLPARRSGIWQTASYYRDPSEPLCDYDEDATFLQFTDEEHERGRGILARMGIKGDRPFICVHARDPTYLTERHDYISEEGWSYHSFRDCSIENYLDAAQWFVGQGGVAVRMGEIVKEPLVRADRSLLPIETGIVDFPVQIRPKLEPKNRSFADIYLAAHCTFFLGCSSGISQVATLFKRPRAEANYPLQEYTTNLSHRDIYIPKRIWDKERERYLSLREILARGIGRFERAEFYEQNGVEMRETPANEILLLCQEMDSKLKGMWQEQEGDAELLEEYWEVMQDDRFRCYGVRAQIATSFLRLHPEYVE